MNKFNAAKPKISCGAHQQPKAWQNSWRAYPPSSSVHTAIWEPIDGAVWYYTCRSICSRVDLAVYNHSIIVLLCWEILNHYRHSRCGVDSNGANLGRATTRPSNASCFIVAGGQIGKKKNIPAIVLLSYWLFVNSTHRIETPRSFIGRIVCREIWALNATRLIYSARAFLDGPHEFIKVYRVNDLVGRYHSFHHAVHPFGCGRYPGVNSWKFLKATTISPGGDAAKHVVARFFANQRATAIT